MEYIYNMPQKTLLKTSLTLLILYVGFGSIGDFFFISTLILWGTIYFAIAYMKLYLKDSSGSVKINIALLLTGLIGNTALTLMTKELKNWRELEARYMTVEEWMRQRESEIREEIRAESLKEGRAKGRAESVLELLEDCGTISEELRDRIFTQRDEEVLKKWHKLAARVSTVEEFAAEI